MRVASPTRAIACVFRRVARPLGVLVFVLALAVVQTLFLPGPAGAQPPLEPRLSDRLSRVGGSVQLNLVARTQEPWSNASVTVEIRGPGSPMAGATDWAVIARVDRSLGDLAAGERSFSVTLGPEEMPLPGAYLLSIDVVADGDRRMSASIWCGRLADDVRPVDVAVVLPLMSGVRRGPEGDFVDDTVQAAVVPNASAAGSLYGLFGAIEQYPDWRLTLAVEPLFLAQLRDLADGYRERSSEGEVTEFSEEEGAAPLAKQAIATLRGVAALGSVHVIPTPYAAPALSVLAREGWDDGFDQMQLGKSELQSTLSLAVIPDGAYAPGLDIATDTLGAFSRASIDYVVVRAEVARDLAEAPEGGRRTVRVQGRENDRLTLVLADEELRAAMVPPWDIDRLAAALAATLAHGVDELVVVAPGEEYATPPAEYLQELGSLLTGQSWIRTRTLDDVLRQTPPETRPIFLSRYGGFVDTYLGRSYVEGLRTAHAAVEALRGAAAAESSGTLDGIRRMLFEAESRYWFAAGIDPEVANRGLALVAAIQDSVAAEFDKVDVAGEKSVIIVGSEGEVPLAVVNQAGYPMDLRLEVVGEGVEIEGGGVLDVSLGLQENIFSFPISVSSGESIVRVSVFAGDMLVDEETVRVRSIPVGPLVAWAVAIVALVGSIGWAVARLRRLRASQAAKKGVER